jgi:hypothetical protein
VRVSGQTRTVVPESARRRPVPSAVVVIRELWDEGSLTRQSITGEYRALYSTLLRALTAPHFEVLQICCMLQEFVASVVSVAVLLVRRVHKFVKSNC